MASYSAGDKVASQPTRMSGWFSGRMLGFLICVVLPVLGTAIYQGSLASDIYESRSMFIVRSPAERPAGGVLGAVLSGSTLASTNNDAYAVQEFMLSRDAMAELNEHLDLRAVFGAPVIDRLSRYPPLLTDHSNENLFKFYRKMVQVEFDPASSISELKVQAFAASDAQKINRQLLQMGERLVNEMNQRAQENAIQDAATEVEDASREIDQAAEAMRSFRNNQLVLNPEKQSVQKLEEIAAIRTTLVETRAQLAQLRATVPDSPQIPGMETRAKALNDQINSEFKLAAGASTSLANLTGQYELLALNQELAAQRLGAAKQVLASTRSEARRQTLYVDRVVEPNLPDAEALPKPLRSTFTMLLACLIGYGLLNLLVASVREHRA